MATFLPDTSCMVAAVCAWHERHRPARDEIERRLDAGAVMISAAPALVETYAVLTRLPSPHRLSPEDTLALLESNFIRDVRLVALNGASYRALLRGAPKEEIAGGRVYDAVIAECASSAGVDEILTFNDKDFAGFDKGFKVVVPGQPPKQS
ncbi:MAG: PIN domain-containing protein [Acidobacteria bacterium]|nr:MAG: PIN domain-containing protein [Acidobacteriota bacterium]